MNPQAFKLSFEAFKLSFANDEGEMVGLDGEHDHMDHLSQI